VQENQRLEPAQSVPVRVGSPEVLFRGDRGPLCSGSGSGPWRVAGARRSALGSGWCGKTATHGRGSICL